MLHLKRDFALAPVEQDIINLLLETRNTYKLNSTLRIAGGWVRDKILGKESDDIDVIIDDMTGATFAELFLKYISDSKRNIASSHGVAVIERNPEQSKHLETARVHVHGLWIDFCNLRSEEYATTRIPTIRFGTPLEDAQRRDFTINTLFYNMHTDNVEDWTGNGFEDLRLGIIRTPLDPRITFMDDPLRILRCVRFTSRLGFKMDPALESCILNDIPHSTILSKVSRERVGKEIFLMLEGNAPHTAMAYILSLNLFSSVFYTHRELDCCVVIEKGDGSYSETAATFNQRISELLKKDEDASKHHSADDHIPQSERNAIFLVSLLLFHLRDCEYEDPLNSRKKQVPFIHHILMDNLKAKKSFVAKVAKTIEGAVACIDIVDRISSGEDLKRSDIGMWMLSACDLWRIAFDLGVLNSKIGQDVWISFRKSIYAHRLDLVWQERKILNGKQVCELLSIKPGPHMGKIMYDVSKWRLDHPNGTAEACKAWLVDHYAEQ